ncbi:MAG: hypothetical protein Q8Q58_13450 [Candidatus Rokubacteria bacterium]|nr:hypothetical protein [Candidatus Rokubacteria bacterium]
MEWLLQAATQRDRSATLGLTRRDAMEDLQLSGKPLVRQAYVDAKVMDDNQTNAEMVTKLPADATALHGEGRGPAR